jgi:hypothetical protein
MLNKFLLVGVCLCAALCYGSASGTKTVFFPEEGYDLSMYEPLNKVIMTSFGGKLQDSEICFAHGKKGFVDGMAAYRSNPERCTAGLVLLGAAPGKSQDLQGLEAPLLVLAGDLDGILRFSSFAAAKHKFGSTKRRFAIIQGASHHSFASGDKPLALDLRPDIGHSKAHSTIAAVVNDFVFSSDKGDTMLKKTEALADKLAAPIIAALKLEGSGALGTDVCKSDFPTNPTCNYPKYPDFALPPGPAPAPSPMPSSDCICGSKWVTDYAFPTVSGAADLGFSLHAADAFHSVSDVHPFHLPHIWNSCPSPSGCDLNVTTLTENLPGSGSLFPNGTGAPLSAYELRTKMKSRTTLYKAVGVKPGPNVDKNLTLCRQANEEAWAWATKNADPSVMKRFDADGEPFVMVDDKEAPIGLKGPEWIEKTLVYNRVKSSSGRTQIEVQSWTFVVGDFPIHSKYLPTGMHYCKLLSPARAMEWLYTDSLRQMRSV